MAQGVARSGRAARFRGRLNGTAPRAALAPAPPAVPRGAVVLLGMAGAVVTIGGMRVVAGFLAPLLLALMLAVTVSPLTTWLRGLGTPTWLATTATVTTVYLLLFLLGGALVLSVARLIDLLPAYADELASLRGDLTGAVEALGGGGQSVRDLIATVEPGTIESVLADVLGTVAGVASNSIFLLAVLLFMCLDAAHLPDRLEVAQRERPQVVGALRSFAQGTRRYLLVSTIFGLIVAVIDTGVLWALGIPLPLLWGLLSFITNYIPNIGFVIGLIPPALLGLFEGGPDLMLSVIVLYSVVNFVIQSIIQPKVVGDAVGLSTTVSFLSLVFWAWVLGPLGALLAIPLSLLAKGLLVDVDPATRWIAPLLSGGSTAPAAPRSGPGRR
ncbi:AI-2E family transporter [Virgisporangium ochraceum]|uniref:AI-2E family transporter n=1 Tax=Virgisporangium ochraceum TaxID=65505 RepID=A0A8J4EFA7_9ACTN|nr:AI-2E family transporter [Virgisporangium ochraceum]